MTPTSRTTRLLLAVPALALLGLAGACGVGDDASDSGSADTASYADSAGGSAEPAAPAAGAPEVADDADDAAGAQAGEVVADQVDPVVQQSAVISTGTVSLRSTDVGQLLFDVQKAVDLYRGEVSERSSESDDDGKVVRSRLVLRVPAASFGELMGALEDTGTLISSDSSSEDVTAQVIDTDVRVSVQKASIERIQALLAQASDLKDVVAIESQLTTRQADLNSLEQTQAYLADQTARSTITVSLERTAKDAPATTEDDDRGFAAGLDAGWDALSGFGTVAATVVGALLPWLVVGAVVAVPAVLVGRRLRRRTTSTPPAAMAP